MYNKEEEELAAKASIGEGTSSDSKGGSIEAVGQSAPAKITPTFVQDVDEEEEEEDEDETGYSALALYDYQAGTQQISLSYACILQDFYSY